MTHNDLAYYVKNREWSFYKESERYLLYSPPETLGMADNFKLFIPNNEEIPDYQEMLDDTIDFVARIYQIDSAEILNSMNGSNGEKVKLSDEGIVEISTEN